ncbi:hypothetical protein M569_12187, partial [Genlisea aurea]
RNRGFDLIRIEEDEQQQDCSVGRRNNISDDFSADVEKVYKILRKFNSKVPKLELALQHSGVSVRSGLTERVLNRCGDAGNLGYRFFVWASKQPGYNHSHDVYKAMIRILGKMRQFGAVWALIEEMRKENPQLLTPEVFIVLMRRFASARMVKKAVEVLDEMPSYGCEPDEYVFGCLLDALCKNGSVKEASLLMEDMQMRFKPTMKHFTSLLHGWCREGKLIEAKTVLQKMREAGFLPDIVVYNTLLAGYAAAGKIADARHLLLEMRRNSCRPTATSYTAVIRSLCAREKMAEAVQLFSEMEADGCEADVVAYTTLISGFCKRGKTGKGYELLDAMIRKGITPNNTTYSYLISAHEKEEELEECLGLAKSMRQIGVTPDSAVYNPVIRLSCKLGEVEDGIRLMNEMEEDGISPGVDTFVILINGLILHGHLDEACLRFEEMVGRGLVAAPQYGLLKDLLNSLLRCGKLQLSKDVWSKMVTSKGCCDVNVYAWTIWIHALLSKGYVKEACFYGLEMMEAGLMPQPDTFAKLIRGLRKLYNREIAAEITEKVKRMAAERHITFKMYKRRGERDLKDKTKAKVDGRKVRARRRRTWG